MSKPTGVENWQTYRSIKLVKAKQIASLSADQSLIIFKDGTTMVPVENMFARKDKTPGPDDWVVVYDDGYISWSPQLPFAAGYVKA